MTDPRRSIPAVDRLLASPVFETLLGEHPRQLVVEAVQTAQHELRASLAGGAPPQTADYDASWFVTRAREIVERLNRRSLRPVINVTGVVLHTNLGRAPLADEAAAAMLAVARGYSNLEYDVERGARGSRYDHCAALLARLSGAPAALVVNNNAAALVLALNTLAREREAIISRGELVEIGGSFRIPEIMARAGTRMVEVGATNRTHLDDYEAAFSERTAVVLKVHPSNFRLSGFTADVDVPRLARLAGRRGVPLLHDLGSGLLLEAASLGLPYEPTAGDALRAGADVVTLSGDKLLGGPQAGILLGNADLIERMRRNPLCRALRVDKVTLAALEATLRLYLDPDRARRAIPVLRMLTMPADTLRARAVNLCSQLIAAGVEATVERGSSAVGGGAFPDVELPTWIVRVATPDPVLAERRLRAGSPAVIARIFEDRISLDPRTLDPVDEPTLLDAVVKAVAP